MEVWSLGQEDPMEEEMATHSSILSWRIPWTEEPGKRPSIHTHTRETSPVVQWLRLHASKAGDVGSIPDWGWNPHPMLPKQGMWVPSPVGEVRSHILCYGAKKKKKHNVRSVLDTGIIPCPQTTSQGNFLKCKTRLKKPNAPCSHLMFSDRIKSIFKHSPSDFVFDYEYISTRK